MADAGRAVGEVGLMGEVGVPGQRAAGPAVGRRRPRRGFVAVVAAAVIAASVAGVTPAVAAPTDCRVVNETQGTSSTTWLGAATAAVDGDLLKVRGRCVVIPVLLATDLRIVGVRTRRSGPPTLDGNGVASIVLSFAGRSTSSVVGLTIRGAAQGIVNYGVLTIRRSRIVGNAGGISGAGIENRGALTIDGSVIRGNSSGGGGGGIDHVSGLLTFTGRNLVAGNTSAMDGGGIRGQEAFAVNGPLTVRGNTSQFGGGLSLYADIAMSAPIVVSGNTSTLDGGGIYSVGTFGADRLLTVAENVAGRHGGGIVNADTFAINAGALISGNRADGVGGGMYNVDLMSFNAPARVTANRADAGGGIYTTSLMSFNEPVRVDGNEATAGDGGGLFVDSGATLSVAGSDPGETQTSIDHNEASGSGGGVRNLGTFAFSSLARIVRNTAVVAGGGVFGLSGASGITCGPVADANVRLNTPTNCGG